jgi:hypothetical protein
MPEVDLSPGLAIARGFTMLRKTICVICQQHPSGDLYVLKAGHEIITTVCESCMPNFKSSFDLRKFLNGGDAS